MLSITVILAALATFSVDVLAAPIQPRLVPRSMSLRRSPNSVHTTSDVEAWAVRNKQNLLVKYGGSSGNKERRGTSGKTGIVNQNADSSFYGTIAVGTPPVDYNVILDTGSSDLWLADSACTNCQGVPTYQSGSSSTFSNLNTTFSIQYGSGESAGVLASETVQMNGFSVAQQKFGLCNTVSTGLLQSPVSGLMGLAFQTISSSGATPFWETLASSSAWTSPVMSFHLTRFDNDATAANLENGGTFTMGGLDTSLYTGNVQFTNIPSGDATYWILPMSSVTVAGVELTLPSGSSSFAAIDTGTTLVGGPSAAIAQIYSKIPGAVPGTGSFESYWIYPCGTQVNAALSFGGGPAWPISDADFQLKEVSPGQCLGAFFELNTGSGAPAWIVGDTFLKNVYSVFQYNPPAVGFAQLSSAALAQNDVSNPSVPSETVAAVVAAVTATAAPINVGGSGTGNAGGSPFSSGSSAGSIISSIFGNAAPRTASSASLGGLLVTLIVSGALAGIL